MKKNSKCVQIIFDMRLLPVFQIWILYCIFRCIISLAQEGQKAFSTKGIQNYCSFASNVSVYFFFCIFFSVFFVAFLLT